MWNCPVDNKVKDVKHAKKRKRKKNLYGATVHKGIVLYAVYKVQSSMTSKENGLALILGLEP